MADNDSLIAEMLKNSETIAVIGFKDNEARPAFRVPYYMHQQGYKIYPVNPGLEGRKLLGMNAFAKVTDIKDKIDLVNIFRRPESLVGHAEEIMQMNPLPKYVWFQLGIYNDEAAEMLEEKGIKVVQSRCIMVEHANL